MIDRVLPLLRHWRDVRTSLGTLSQAWGGDSSIDMVGQCLKLRSDQLLRRRFDSFAIRYFLKGGILDGYGGWMWNFWQGLWYRCLVDREIGRMKNH